MSAPPGWHLQPDGRERWWDGQQWTEQFRSPLPSDPTAPPAEPADPSSAADILDSPVPGPGDAPAEGQGSVPPPWTTDRTQALDVDRTQAIPAPPPGGYGTSEPPPTYPGQQDYSYPSGGGGLPPSSTGYPGGGYGTGYGTGYGATGGQYPPPRQGMSGAAKGCLFAAIGILVIIVIAVVAAVFFFARTANRISDEISSGIPTNLPSDLPSGLPSDLSSVGGETVTIAVGDGFDLPRARIAGGWSVKSGSFGSEVSGMKATFTESQAVPVVFSMSFRDTGSGKIETVCTAAPASSTATTADVTCIPIFGKVDDNAEVAVTPAF
jgi:hypothetical protein